MDWIQFVLFVLTIVGMFRWIQSDLSDLRKESAADRRDILMLIRSIQEEIKDFHGRLCAIEERNRK